MNDLRDLLKHEVEDLYSAEEQIIEALPAMIDKASNTVLKNSLSEHLRVTEQQKERLNKVLELLNGGQEDTEKKNKKFLGLFGGGSHKCKGMEGIISEGKKTMGTEMDADVMDAALIACAQKVEHYEICGYGTARSYATELGLHQVASLLEMTLDEEYEADDKLTFLAESRINKQAERNGGHLASTASRSKSESSRSTARKKEMELEPVASRRQRTESKSDSNNERASKPKSATTPRSSAGRTASTDSRRTSSKSSSASKSRESGSGSKRSGSGSARNR